jgi:hypothetical protein
LIGCGVCVTGLNLNAWRVAGRGDGINNGKQALKLLDLLKVLEKRRKLIAGKV